MVRWFFRWFFRSFVRLFVRSFVRSFVLSFVRSFVRSSVSSFVRSFVRINLSSISRYIGMPSFIQVRFFQAVNSKKHIIELNSIHSETLSIKRV